MLDCHPERSEGSLSQTTEILRSAQNDKREDDLVLLLPGSREREVAKIWPIMAKVVEQMPDEVKFIAAAVNEKMAAMIGHPRVKVEVGTAQELMQRAALAITASGTATMECAFYGCPMIVVYKVNWLTYLIGRMVVTVNWLAMPNVIAGREIVPEFIQGAATSDRITAVARELLENATKREAMQKELAAVVGSLGNAGASERAARLILTANER
jgi:lipid-A-disaccharide synthase